MNRVFAFRESVLFILRPRYGPTKLSPEVERNYEQRACFVESYLDHIVDRGEGPLAHTRTLVLFMNKIRSAQSSRVTVKNPI
jgi:hypothetical protein